jgi:hypothetical protein
MGRCGHSATIYNDYLVIFGGMYEITKELNDCFVFNLETRVWTKICSSPFEGDLSNTQNSTDKRRAREDLSPGIAGST